MSKQAFEVIQPRNTLREKMGGRMPALDAAALARAEEALKSLSTQFQGWMEDEVANLDAARREAVARGFDVASIETLFGRAHDAKGMGSTYEYPLVTRIAASLCKMLETQEARAAAAGATALLEAHVDAIRAAVRGRIKTDADPVGAALASELEKKSAEFLAKAGL